MKIELGRPFAASLLLAVLLALGGLAVAAAWADLSTAEDERDAKSAFVSRGVRTVQGAPDPGSTAAPAKLFVEAESETLAAARIDALVRSAAADAGGAVLSSQAEVKQDEAGIGGRIEIQAVLEAENDALQAILLHLESGAPMMLVDDLAIQPVEAAPGTFGDSQSPRLHAAVTLSAYWIPPQK